jgi:hypothetical protein
VSSDTPRRAWCQPKLIVLVRGTPEENVLQNCKSSGSVVNGNVGLVDWCAKSSCVSSCPQQPNT